MLAFVLFLSLCALPARAQECIGLFNSIKGFGAEARTSEVDGIFHSATAYVDIYGVATSRCSYPGLRMNVSRNYVISRSSIQDITMTFYAGPGVTAGLVRDHDKGRGLDLTSLFGNNEGVVLAISGSSGCRFDFPGRIALNLSFTADLGIHIRRYELEKGYFAPSVSIYNNGYMQALYPQLSILFKL